MKIYIPNGGFQHLVYNGEVNLCNANLETITIHNCIKQNICWLCGGKEKITKHHVLNKCWKPKKNIYIPLCKECHLKIHGMQQKIKLNKKIREVQVGSRINRNLVTSNEKLVREINTLRKTRDEYISKQLEDKSKELKNNIRIKEFNGSKWVRFK